MAIPKVIEPRDARHVWRLFHAPTNAAAWRRAESDKLFVQWFPTGHEYSLRPLVEAYAKHPRSRLFRGPKTAFLRAVLPDACAIIAQYGIDYVSGEFFDRGVYDSKLQPVIYQCFANAHRLMDAFCSSESPEGGPALYVEGITFGIGSDPMLHGWNACPGSSKAFDWTYYPTTQWTRYLGIPFTREECAWLSERAGQQGPPFFHRKRFHIFKPYLLELLERRSQEALVPAA